MLNDLLGTSSSSRPATGDKKDFVLDSRYKKSQGSSMMADLSKNALPIIIMLHNHVCLTNFMYNNSKNNNTEKEVAGDDFSFGGYMPSAAGGGSRPGSGSRRSVRCAQPVRFVTFDVIAAGNYIVL